MADTSRHFLTVAMLYRLLDSMSYAKLNVLHWHIVSSHCNVMQLKCNHQEDENMQCPQLLLRSELTCTNALNVATL